MTLWPVSEIAGDNPEPTREELLKALGLFRDHRLAEMLVILFGMAAETHPDMIKAALGQVFDLSCIEETTKRSVLIATKAQELAQECYQKAQEAEQEIGRLRGELDGYRVVLNKLAGRLKKAGEYVTHLEQRLKKDRS